MHSVARELVVKSREAALTAVQVFNNPLVEFKSETYIVLMVIAWTYLLHAHYRRKAIEYRYFEEGPKKRRFLRTKHGSHRCWELERCLAEKASPVDKDATNNLLFLIRLRHEIEHQMTRDLDNYLSGRYQACALNYNHYLKKLFGDKNGIDRQLTYALQFVKLSHEQAAGISLTDTIPKRLLAFVADFDSSLGRDERDSERFSYRMIFTKKLTGNPNQADRVVEFIDPESDAGKQLEKAYCVIQEKEKRKTSAGSIVAMMRAEGYSGFNIHHHTELWKEKKAKEKSGKYGCQLGPQYWWYDAWIEVVREHCKANAAKYRAAKTNEQRE